MSDEQRVGKRGEQKRRWDRNNTWRDYDECPICGGMKSVGAKRCFRCKPNNLAEYNRMRAEG